MGKPYSDHPVYRAMAAILAQSDHPEAKSIDLSLSYCGDMSISCGLHPGFSDGAFVIGGSSHGGENHPEIFFVEEGWAAARQLAAALSAWADWDEAKYTAMLNGADDEPVDKDGL
jgi:hypothetical protein